jgi:hypothetical protein
VKKALLASIIFFTTAFALRYSGLELTYLQLIFLPVLLWIFNRVLPKELQISKYLALAILVSASLGVGISYNLEAFKSGGVLVARFSDDPLENQSRVFRHKVSEVLARLPGAERVYRYPTEIKSQAKALKLLKEENRIGVLWGSSRAVNVSVRSPHNDSLENVIGPSLHEIGIPNLSRLYLARNVSVFGMPIDEKGPADMFVGYLLTALQAETPAVRSSFIAQTLALWGPWKWLDHRAYPYWLEGTDKLIDSLDSGQVEPAELECAYRYLKKAMTFLHHPGAHPKLAAAILNNLAIASYVKRAFDYGKNPAPSYYKPLHQAELLAPDKGKSLKYNMHLVAVHNLAVLKQSKEHLKDKGQKSVKRRSN